MRGIVLICAILLIGCTGINTRKEAKLGHISGRLFGLPIMNPIRQYDRRIYYLIQDHQVISKLEPLTDVFQFNNLKAGKYSVTANAPGYSPYTLSEDKIIVYPEQTTFIYGNYPESSIQEKPIVFCQEYISDLSKDTVLFTFKLEDSLSTDCQYTYNLSSSFSKNTTKFDQSKAINYQRFYTIPVKPGVYEAMIIAKYEDNDKYVCTTTSNPCIQGFYKSRV